MSPTAVLHRPTFEPEQEARYIRQLLDRAVIIARVGSVAAAISFIAYGGWDLYLDSASLSATGPLRLATAASFGLVVGATYWQPIRTQPRYWSLVLLLAFTLGWPLRLDPFSSARWICRRGARLHPRHDRGANVFGSDLLRRRCFGTADRIPEYRYGRDRCWIFRIRKCKRLAQRGRRIYDDFRIPFGCARQAGLSF